jgi:hypothetical protein
MGVMEIYVVAKKHTANAMMRNLIMYQRLAK